MLRGGGLTPPWQARRELGVLPTMATGRGGLGLCKERLVAHVEKAVVALDPGALSFEAHLPLGPALKCSVCFLGKPEQGWTGNPGAGFGLQRDLVFCAAFQVF